MTTDQDLDAAGVREVVPWSRPIVTKLDDETLAHIERLVAEAPPLTVEQIATLRRILGPGSEPGPSRETTPAAA